MLTDNDVQKLIEAMKEVFPTAEMIKRSFDHVDERFDGLEKIYVRQEEYTKLLDRVKRLEQAIGIHQ
jgi:RNA binding exosome subunit